MKQLGAAPDSTGWNASLVAQLGFIRKHLCYPLSRKTLFPLAGIMLFQGVAVWWLVPRIWRVRSTTKHPEIYLLLLLLLLPLFVALGRYLRSLRFVPVPAAPLLAQNMVLVQRFLSENHFAFSRHPEAPEVFQILSRDLGGRQELREILLFIADDGRILLNSHFTGKGLGPRVGSGKSHAMARLLAKWLQAQQGMNFSTEIRRL